MTSEARDTIDRRLLWRVKIQTKTNLASNECLLLVKPEAGEEPYAELSMRTRIWKAKAKRARMRMKMKMTSEEEEREGPEEDEDEIEVGESRFGRRETETVKSLLLRPFPSP